MREESSKVAVSISNLLSLYVRTNHAFSHITDAERFEYHRVKADGSPDTWGYVGHCVIFE